MPSAISRATGALAVAALAFACGGDGDGTGPRQSVTISLSSPSLSVQCGSTGSLTVSLSRQGGFSGVVSLSVTGLPDDVGISVTPSQLSGSTTSATIEVTAELFAIPGSYPLVVTATSSLGSVTAPYTLILTEPPDFSLNADPASLTIVRGATGSSTIEVTRVGGFSAAVTLSLVTPPDGLTGAFDPEVVTGTASTLTIAVAPSVAAGSYTVTVGGASTLFSARTVDLFITVADPPDYSVAVEPTSLSILRGGSGNATVTITRSGGFAGDVGLTLVSPPAGISAAFNPPSTTGTTSALRVDVATSVTAGDYALTIRASASGLPNRDVPLSVSVSDPPDYALALNPSALTIDRGTSASTAVEITRSGGFAGAVQLSLDGAPAGVTAAFNPPAPTGSAATMTVSVGASVAAGPYNLTVRGNATGAGEHTTPFALTVRVAGPSIALLLDRTSLTLEPWEDDDVHITIERTNYAAAVDLAASGAPPGMTVSIVPGQTLGTTATATVDVGPSVPVGSYPITISGSGAGVATATRVLQVEVEAAPGPTLEYDLCVSSDRVLFFAVQNGMGEWRALTPTVVGGTAHFRFPLPAGFGGVAFVVPGDLDIFGVDRAGAGRATARRAAPRALNERAGWPRRAGRSFALASDVTTPLASYFLFGTTADLLREGTDLCWGVGNTATYNGSVAGFGTGDHARVAFGGASAFVVGAPFFQLTEARSGTNDLFASRHHFGVVDRWFIHRDLNIPSAGTMPVVDFLGGSSVAAGSGNVTVTNSLGDWLVDELYYETSNGFVGQVGVASEWTTPTLRPFPTIPASHHRSGDVMGVWVGAESDAFPQSERLVLVATDPGATAVTAPLGPRITEPNVTQIASTPYLRLRTQGAMPAGFGDAVLIGIIPRDGGNRVAIGATSGYLAQAGSASTYDLSMPDLSALPGFPLNSALPPGETFVGAQVVEVTGTERLNPDQPLRVGMTVQWSRAFTLRTF
jgi:uncharacterized membrane protein